MDFFYRIIGTPLGWVMWLCYQLTTSYGFSLFLFTLITRLIMLPLAIKQQKGTARMTMLKPQIDQLQKKYGDNKQKLNEETMALYQKEGYNPMSGCLPLLIQMPILFGLIDVIYRPMKHILRLPVEVVNLAESIALKLELVPTLKGLNAAQIRAIQSINENIQPWIELGQENLNKILSLDMHFLGIDLGLTPSYSMFGDIFSKGVFSPLLLVPLLSGISALLLSLISMRNAAGTTEAGAAAGSMKSMMFMTPIFSFVIAFNVPAGVGIYWFYSNLLALIQSLALYKFYNPKEIAEKARIEFEERQEAERQERIEAKKQAKLGAKAIDEKAMTQKEINRKKLAEARKRTAERYGEEYVEVTDDDIK